MCSQSGVQAILPAHRNWQAWPSFWKARHTAFLGCRARLQVSRHLSRQEGVLIDTWQDLQEGSDPWEAHPELRELVHEHLAAIFGASPRPSPSRVAAPASPGTSGVQPTDQVRKTCIQAEWLEWLTSPAVLRTRTATVGQSYRGPRLASTQLRVDAMDWNVSQPPCNVPVTHCRIV